MPKVICLNCKFCDGITNSGEPFCTNKDNDCEIELKSFVPIENLDGEKELLNELYTIAYYACNDYKRQKAINEILSMLEPYIN
jgi:hypothetical protein